MQQKKFSKTELSNWSLYICASFGHVDNLLAAFLKNELLFIWKNQINYIVIVCLF